MYPSGAARRGISPLRTLRAGGLRHSLLTTLVFVRPGLGLGWRKIASFNLALEADLVVRAVAPRLAISLNLLLA